MVLPSFSAWREWLPILAVGLVLGLLVGFLPGLLHDSRPVAVPEGSAPVPEVATVPPALATGAAGSNGTLPGWPGEGAAGLCHLGAVVAEESADVAAEMAGLIESLNVRVGDSVGLGALLGRLDTRQLGHQLAIEKANLQQSLAEAKSRQVEADRAEAEYERRRKLEGLVSREEQEAARLKFEQAKAALEAAGADRGQVEARIAELQDQIARAALRAPFAGRVVQRYLDPGARVEVGTPILRLLRAEGLLVRFALPPEAVAGLRQGALLEVAVVEPPLLLRATVEQISPEIDPESLLVFAEARLEPPPSGTFLPFGAEAWVGPVGHGEACRQVAIEAAGGH